MDAATVPSATVPSPAPPADASVAAPRGSAPWSPSVQSVLSLLLAAGLLFLAGASFRQSLDAGPSTVPAQRMDLNTATSTEFVLLPGVGEQLARSIERDRNLNGPYQKVDDLRRVPGFGLAKLERLRAWVFVAPSPARAFEGRESHSVEPPRRSDAKPRKGTNLTSLIDVNSAGASELQQLPGIGPTLSQRIVSERGRKPFQAVADLRRVKGIGPKTLEKVRPFVTVGPATITSDE